VEFLPFEKLAETLESMHEMMTVNPPAADGKETQNQPSASICRRYPVPVPEGRHGSSEYEDRAKRSGKAREGISV
jgi:hypothetical protein